MKKGIGILDEVVQFLSDVKDPNDPDDVMTFKELDLVVSKISSDRLKGNTVNFTWGGLLINETADIFDGSSFDCVENKVGIREHKIWLVH